MTIQTKPIPFSAPMVQALLREIRTPGTGKTQTRRIFKVRGPMGVSYPVTSPEESLIELCDNELRDHGTIHYLSTGALSGPYKCPYGKPGGLIYVRESYFQRGHWEPVEGKRTKSGRQKWAFIPENDDISFEAPGQFRKGRHHKDPATIAWHQRLGRFMPRRYSRITLEVTDVRVQRLQDMDGQAPYPGESDALAEGIHRIHHGDGAYYYSAFRDEPDGQNWCDPTDAFRELWESINGSESWDANPWVWAVSFKPHLINVDQFIKGRAAA